MPVRLIGARYGVHRATVSEIARQSGATVREPGLIAKDRARAALLYAGGMTLTQVAQRMGVGEGAVRRAVLVEGGQIRPRGRRPR
ncbi:helix-turn-helix domain-containing protein [Propionibacterium freudenreichii]|uniref:helix-turn-helix domain-containing protein n=1 Tax=Propionibacterium freudenreichii TaxID=1744 RepID=UPI0009BFF5FB